MMDFVALPPEVNSARMYTGPGASPLIAAATAWEATAAELGSTMEGISQVVAGLTGAWRGPSSLAMIRMLTGYQQWLMSTALLAEHTAAQTSAAVVAYETAFAATVPPPIIAANRALLAALVATNFLGVNTPAIMATEAHYMEMWAQDVAAMFGYQTASAQAATLPPFTPPVASTSPVQVTPALVGLGESIFAPGSNQSTTGLAGLLNLLSGSNGSAFGTLLNSNWVSTGVVNSLFSSGFYYGLPQALLSAITSTTALGQTQRQIVDAEDNVNPPQPAEVQAPSVLGAHDASPEASMGRAGQVGALSTPQSWRPSPYPSTATALDAGEDAPSESAPFGGPLMAGLGNQVGLGNRDRARYGVAVKGVIQRHPSGG